MIEHSYAEFISLSQVISLQLYIPVFLQPDLLDLNHFGPSSNADYGARLLVSIFVVLINLPVIWKVPNIYKSLLLRLLSMRLYEYHRLNIGEQLEVGQLQQ